MFTMSIAHYALCIAHCMRIASSPLLGRIFMEICPVQIFFVPLRGDYVPWAAAALYGVWRIRKSRKLTNKLIQINQLKIYVVKRFIYWP